MRRNRFQDNCENDVAGGNAYSGKVFRMTVDIDAHDLPAYEVNETVTAMDNDFCSTGTWKAADKIQPFTAFLLPGANGTFTVKLEGSGVTIHSEQSPVSAGAVRFMGIYGPKVLPAGSKDILYVGADGKLYYPNADVTMGAFRAYLEVMLGGDADPNTAIIETYSKKEKATDGNWNDGYGGGGDGIGDSEPV